MKKTLKLIVIMAVTGSLISCFNKEKPNYQYFSNLDMYKTPAYKAYREGSIFQQDQSALSPAEGTINRGYEVFEYPETLAGRNDATENLKNPLPFTERNVNKGKEIYDIYCAICHGAKGDGQGPLTTREKILGIPGFDDPNRNMTEGGIYYVAYYGLNNMGSYASQTTTKERWQIIHYIQTLQDELLGREKRAFVSDTSLNRDHYDKEVTPKINQQSLSFTDKN